MRDSVRLILLLTIVFTIFFAATSFLAAWIVMLLWNWIMPEIFGLAALTYWKAFGLLWMCTLLFRSVNIHGSKS